MRKQARFEILLDDREGNEKTWPVSVTVSYYKGRDKAYFDRSYGAMVEDDTSEAEIIYSSRGLNEGEEQIVLDEFWSRYYANEL